MQNSSEFQYIAIDQLFMNPRPITHASTFDQKQARRTGRVHPHQADSSSPSLCSPNRPGPSRSLQVRDASVRDSLPKSSHSPPASSRTSRDAQAILEWQLSRELAAFEDVHPYEEAQGFQTLA